MLQRLQIDGVEGLGVVEIVAEWIGARTILMQQLHLQPIGVPIGQGRRRAHRAADAVTAEGAFAGHFERLGIRLIGA